MRGRRAARGKLHGISPPRLGSPSIRESRGDRNVRADRRRPPEPVRGRAAGHEAAGGPQGAGSEARALSPGLRDPTQRTFRRRPRLLHRHRGRDLPPRRQGRAQGVVLLLRVRAGRREGCRHPPRHLSLERRPRLLLDLAAHGIDGAAARGRAERRAGRRAAALRRRRQQGRAARRDRPRLRGPRGHGLQPRPRETRGQGVLGAQRGRRLHCGVHPDLAHPQQTLAVAQVSPRRELRHDPGGGAWRAGSRAAPWPSA